MLSNYQDKHTLWHDKPCKDGEPSSNNGFIYSAYARYLAPKTVNNIERHRIFADCSKSYFPLKIDRLPHKILPPQSKDEIIGMVSSGLVTLHELEASHWNFCNFMDYEPKKLTLKSVFKAAKILWNIRKEHRNYVWENKLEDAYCLAFYLAPWDQYYVKKYYKKRPNLLQTLAFYINFINVLTKGNKSARLLLWLQLSDLEHPLLKLVPYKKWVRDYFDPEHPFVEDL